MRQIKFRVWNINLKKWVFPCYDITNPFKTGESNKVMQYTGCRDKNGKEIFEGDVVKCISEEEYHERTGIREIIFSQGCGFCFREPTENGIVYTHGLPLNWGGYISIEIIGNIYETPELLK